MRETHLKSAFILRRFKTADPAELEELRTLFAGVAVLKSPRLDRIIEAGADGKGFRVLMPGLRGGHPAGDAAARPALGRGV
ncbi:MAG: hypothetical protein RIS79_3609 [Verrucomicrobiota bacterium]|jgi:hypothetical protein